MTNSTYRSFFMGLKSALPLVGGYIPIAISFGLISVQAGFKPWEAVAISTLIYAGGSQFLFVGLVAANVPLWLVVILSLLVNARHVVYGPNIAPWISSSYWWPLLSHGLTDQVFAISHSELPKLDVQKRLSWFAGIMLLAWASWVGGTAIGAYSGNELLTRWPLVGEISGFALPALFLALLIPYVRSMHWLVTLLITASLTIVLSFTGVKNFSIPLSALLGCCAFYALKQPLTKRALA